MQSFFPGLVENLIWSFKLSVFALIMPFKMILFTVHNYLTKRDYTYSADDLSDFAIAVCVAVWIFTYIKWS